MRDKLVVSVDPGSPGAAACLQDGKEVVACWAWKPVQRDNEAKVELQTMSGTGRRTDIVASLFDAGREIADWFHRNNIEKYALIVEGLFVGKNDAGALTLAEEAALVYGPLLGGSEGGLLRPLASEWRPMMLGIGPKTKADHAEFVAKKIAPHVFVGIPEEAKDNGHVCEALWIGRYAWIRAREKAIELPFRKK